MSFANSPFNDPEDRSDELEIVATMSERAIYASILERQSQDDLLIAIREAAKQGVDLDSLSDASGLSIEVIRSNLGEFASSV